MKIKPAPAHLAIASLEREIKNNWDTIGLLETAVLDAGSAWIREMALQGQRLTHLKTQLPHGDWLPWCETQSALGVSYDRINQCMRVAANLERVQELDGNASLRQVLAICAAKELTEATPPKRWPAYLEGLNRYAKFRDYVKTCPLKDWPPEGVDKLREDFEPTARELWPERFA